MNFARMAGWLAIALALLLAGLILHDEIVGETSSPNLRRPVADSGVVVSKSEFPKQFREIITFKWYRSLACVGAGVLLLAFARRADRLDPFHPDFAGNQALDEWGESLQKKKSESASNRKASQTKD